ncbi:MAG TPA: hypothetical protein VFB99_22970, partial [Vicinamibacterales bacterium]|nr:hypothetical protein [Vicinamibacterales bacterium]
MVLPIDQAMCPLRRAVVLYSAVAIVLAGASVVTAQSTTYHLHRETSSTSGLFQLKTASPDASSLT